jgi:hypothetical protein
VSKSRRASVLGWIEGRRKYLDTIDDLKPGPLVPVCHAQPSPRDPTPQGEITRAWKSGYLMAILDLEKAFR